SVDLERRSRSPPLRPHQPRDNVLQVKMPTAPPEHSREKSHLKNQKRKIETGTQREAGRRRSILIAICLLSGNSTRRRKALPIHRSWNVLGQPCFATARPPPTKQL